MRQSYFRAMFNEEELAQANAWRKNTMVEGLGITFVPSAPGTFAATMPVDHRTKQAMGLLHGGATAALAETLGSVGSALLIDRDKHAVVGVEINANHLRVVTSGTVTATATPVHKGRSTQVWAVEIRDDAGRLVCVSRCTLAVLAAHG